MLARAVLHMNVNRYGRRHGDASCEDLLIYGRPRGAHEMQMKAMHASD